MQGGAGVTGVIGGVDRERERERKKESKPCLSLSVCVQAAPWTTPAQARRRAANRARRGEAIGMSSKEAEEMMMKTMDMMDMIMLVVYPGATCRSIRRTRRWRRRRREGATRRLLAAVFRRRTSPSMPWDTPPTLIRPSGRRYGTITPAARRWLFSLSSASSLSVPVPSDATSLGLGTSAVSRAADGPYRRCGGAGHAGRAAALARVVRVGGGGGGGIFL